MKFAKRMERMQSSEIRELLKLTAQPDIISFAGGLPAPELFPVKEIAKVSHDLVEKEGQQLLQYATTEGRPTLRAKIAARMKDKYHTEVDPDEILITPVHSSVLILPVNYSLIQVMSFYVKVLLIWVHLMPLMPMSLLL